MTDMNPGKDFAHTATDLTDRELTELFKTVEQVRQKYSGLPNTADNLEKLRDETLTRLMEAGILATLDPSPCFHGQPPVIEIVGKIDADQIHTHGFDHEQKGWEVNKANTRGEDWLGQKEKPDKGRKK